MSNEAETKPRKRRKYKRRKKALAAAKDVLQVYPCCGCGPEGCIDFSRTVECADCGKTYHPDQNTGVYCYACLSTPKWKPPKYVEVTSEMPCNLCKEEADRDRRRGLQPSKVNSATVMLDGKKEWAYCDGCADDVVADWQDSFNMDVAEGRYDHDY